jgi:hypothetical protein
LFLNGGEDGLFAGDQLAQIEELFFDGADLDLIEVACRFLAIASDEWDGGTFIEELDRGQEAFHRDLERAGNVHQKIGR